MDRRLIAWFVLAIVLSSFLIIVQRQSQPYPIHVDEWYPIYHERVIEQSDGLARYQGGFHTIISTIDRFTPVHAIWIVLVLIQLALFLLATSLILATRGVPLVYAPLPLMLAALTPSSNATFSLAFFVPFTLALTIGLFSWIHTRFSLLRIIPVLIAATIHPVAAGITGIGLASILWFSNERKDRIAAGLIIAIGAIAYFIITPSLFIGPTFDRVTQSAQPLPLVTIVALAGMLIARIRWTLIPIALLGSMYVLGTLGLPTIGIPYWRATLALSLIAPTLALLTPKHRSLTALALVVAVLIMPQLHALSPVHDIKAIEQLPLENATFVSAPLEDALRIGAIHRVEVAASQYFLGPDRDRIARASIDDGRCIDRADATLPAGTRSVDVVITDEPYGCFDWITIAQDPYVSVRDPYDPPWWNTSWPYRQRIFHGYEGEYATLLDNVPIEPFSVRIMAYDPMRRSYTAIPSNLERGFEGPIVTYALGPEHDVVYTYMRASDSVPEPFFILDEDADTLIWIDGDRSNNTSFSIDGSTATIIAGGSDVWMDTNEYAGLFIDDPSAEFVATTTVVDQQRTHEWAKSGIMMRNRLNASSPYAIVALTPEHGVIFEFDSDRDGRLDTHTNVPNVSAPVELTLKRSADSIEARYRTNASADIIGRWYTRQTGSQVGVFHMSHDPLGSGTGSFEGFTVLRISDSSQTGPREVLTT